MELLNRYLHAVRFWLPRKQQDDIVAELSEDFRSQIEEKEAELGRKINETELEAILKQRGHPMLVASRFLPRQHLIGPAFFPTYRFVLKLVILWVLVPLFWLVIGPIALMTRGNPGAQWIVNVWSSFWVAAIIAFATITLIFALLERFQVKTKFFENWNPRSLPRVPDRKNIPLAASIVEIVFGIWAALWWANLVQFPGASAIERAGIKNWMWGAAWQDLHQNFFLPGLVLLLLGVAIACVNFYRPSWTPARLGIRAGTKLAIAGIVSFVLHAHWGEFHAMCIKMTSQNAGMPQTEVVAGWVSVGVSITLLTVAATYVIQGLSEIYRMFRMRAARLRMAVSGLAAVVALLTVGTITMNAGVKLLAVARTVLCSPLSPAATRRVLQQSAGVLAPVLLRPSVAHRAATLIDSLT